MVKNKLLITSLFMMFFIQQTVAQSGYAWDQLGNGFNKNNKGCTNIVYSKYINGELYVTQNDSGIITIHKWNGTNWSYYPSFGKKYQNYTIEDLEIFNNQLHVSGDIYSINGLQRADSRRSLGIIRFNGTNWDSLQNYPDFNNFSDPVYDKDSMDMTTKMQVFQNKLFFIVGTIYHSVFSIDINGVLKREFQMNDIGFLTNLMLINNKLVIAGHVKTINANLTSGMVFYDGISFKKTSTYKLTYVNLAFKRNNNQFVIINDSNKIELWSNDTLIKYIPKPNANFKWWQTTGMTFFNDFLILTNNTDTFNKFYDLNSNQWFYNTSLNPLTYNYVAVPTGNTNNAYIVNCSKFKGAAELKLGAIVKGKLYADKNKNCAYESTVDIGVKNSLIEFDNGTNQYYTSTDVNGDYEISVLAGNYNVNFINTNIDATIAPCSNISLNASAGTTYNNLRIPMRLNSNKNLGINISANLGFRKRLGFTETYYLSGTNYHFDNDSLVMSLKYPSKITFVNSDITPFSNTNNELIFKFANISFLASKRIKIMFKSNIGDFSLGDNINFYAKVLNSYGDSRIENNFDTLEQKIFGAFDPNIKQSYPEGNITQNLKKIKYVIHFQNTGNDTAYKVSVVDTFTQKLGLRALKITGTSHPQSYSLRVEKGNVLIWEFNNILLPDSHTNEKASHGHIAFETEINGSLAVGEKIENRAFIYFDYQKPIITNYATILRTNQLMIEKEINLDNSSLKIYPNPSSGFVNLEFENNLLNQKFEIYNQFGQMVLSSEFNDDLKSINMSNFSNGLYILKVNNSEIATKFLIMN